jgi:hypothetical protein
VVVPLADSSVRMGVVGLEMSIENNSEDDQFNVVSPGVQGGVVIVGVRHGSSSGQHRQSPVAGSVTPRCHMGQRGDGDCRIRFDQGEKLRGAVRTVNGVLSSLCVEKHPDKTFIGRIKRGFDFLCYRFGSRYSNWPRRHPLESDRGRATVVDQGRA